MRDAILEQADSEDLADLARALGVEVPADLAPPTRLYDYWGPRGFVLDSPVAPGADYYRLVNEDAEAFDALDAGEPPLHGHRGMSPVELEQQRLLQWEGPNRLFNRTTDGRIESMDDPDNGTFVPLWNSEGETGSLLERQRLLEHLWQTDPDLLREPGAGLPPLIVPDAPRADLARPLRVAQGESIFDNQAGMQQRGARGIPSQREGDIAVPPPWLERREFPMPSVIPLDSGPTTPPDMPHDLLPLGRPPVERAAGVIPLAQAWPHLLGRTA